MKQDLKINSSSLQETLNELSNASEEVKDNLCHIYKAINELKQLCSSNTDEHIDELVNKELLDEVCQSLL